MPTSFIYPRQVVDQVEVEMKEVVLITVVVWKRS
jgi:hypothetical protein